MKVHAATGEGKGYITDYFQEIFSNCIDNIPWLNQGGVVGVKSIRKALWFCSHTLFEFPAEASPVIEPKTLKTLIWFLSLGSLV